MSRFVAAAVVWLAGCHAASVATSSGPEPTIVVLAVPAMPDSAVAMTRTALGEAKGTVPTIQWSPNEALLATRYRKNRRGPGVSEITIAAAVSRRAIPGPDASNPRNGATTRVQLQAWAMDSVAQRSTIGGPGMSTETFVSRPKPVSSADSSDWAPVQRVLDAFTLEGARLVSANGPGFPKRP